jgi:hypothetical protein
VLPIPKEKPEAEEAAPEPEPVAAGTTEDANE